MLWLESFQCFSLERGPTATYAASPVASEHVDQQPHHKLTECSAKIPEKSICNVYDAKFMMRSKLLTLRWLYVVGADHQFKGRFLGEGVFGGGGGGWGWGGGSTQHCKCRLLFKHNM